jgi:hypothetical protein
MKPGTFDDLTRRLANTTSRRGAFRRIAGMLAGGTVGGAALAGLSPGIVLANGGNSDCAHFCNAIFAPGSARGQCKDDAAHGTGLCYSCGPKASGGSQPICCSTDSNGFCTSYSSATCCSGGQSCQSGTCVTTCNTTVLSNGTTVQPCDRAVGCSCGFCIFGGSPSETFCSNDVRPPGDLACFNHAGCPLGSFCDGAQDLCFEAVICC